jgi:hypothetical protein
VVSEKVRGRGQRSERMDWHLPFCQRLRLGISRIDLRADAADLRRLATSRPRLLIGFGVHLSTDPRWTAEPNRERGFLHRYREGYLAFALPPAA